MYFSLFLISILYDYFIGSGCRSSVEVENVYSHVRSVRLLQMFLFWLPIGVLFCPLLFSYRPYVGMFSRTVQLVSDLATGIFCTVFLILFYHIWMLLILPTEARTLMRLDLLPGCFPGFSGLQPTNFFRSVVSELHGILLAFQGSAMMRKMFPPTLIAIQSLLLISQIPCRGYISYSIYNKVVLLIFGGGLYYFLANA